MNPEILAERMLDAMMDVAMGQPKPMVAEAATRCCIAIIRGCVQGGNMSMDAALADIGMRMVMAAKGG